MLVAVALHARTITLYLRGIDLFLDIYNDVKTGLLMWNAGAPTEMTWHWRFNFEAHWGRWSDAPVDVDVLCVNHWA